MSGQYNIFTRAELITMLKETNAELTKLQATEAVKPDAVNKQMITSLTTKSEDIRSAIISTQANTQSTFTSQQDYNFIQLASTMASAVKDVKRLEPGIPAEDFIGSLRNVYDLLVKPEVSRHPRLEIEFLKQARLRMSETYNTQLSNSGVQITTFEEFRNYVTKTHGSQLTNYQLLSRAWDLELEPSESLTDFATKLELRMRDASQQIEARYKAEHTSPGNQNPEMSSKAAFQLIGGMLMSEKIKQRSPVIFSHLVRSMDKHYSASTIAHEAKLYEERLGNQDYTCETSFQANNSLSQYSTYISKSNSGSQHRKRQSHSNELTSDRFDYLEAQSKVCFNFPRGKPCFYNPCPFQHLETYEAHASYDIGNISSDETDFHSDMFA